MEPPEQRPPVERLYMRRVVGRGGKPDRPADDEAASSTTRKHGKRQRREGADYLVELTTFHVRPRGRW